MVLRKDQLEDLHSDPDVHDQGGSLDLPGAEYEKYDKVKCDL